MDSEHPEQKPAQAPDDDTARDAIDEQMQMSKEELQRRLERNNRIMITLLLVGIGITMALYFYFFMFRSTIGMGL